MIKVHELRGLTVGELKKELEGIPDGTPVLLENVADKLYYKNNYECAILTCDENQFSCLDLKEKGEFACTTCPYAHSYTTASRVVKADNVIYLDITF